MLPMPNAVAFSLFGFDIRWYAIIMVIAIITAFGFGYFRMRRFEITDNDLMDYFLWVVPLSIVGARLYYVAFEWHRYKNNPISILYLRNGGLAVHGALIAGIIVTYFFCRFKKINFFKFLDLAAPCMILGQAIGRWGNYFNMEAYGSMTDLPWHIPVLDLAGEVRYVHPTFLYESLWDLLVFFILIYYEDHYQKSNGQGACMYLFLYSLGRFFIEGLRTDSLIFLGLKQAQIISVACMLGSLILFIYLQLKGKPFKLLNKEEAKKFAEEQKQENLGT